MPRPPRVDYASAIHHVMNRAGHRGRIFHSKLDRQAFLERLSQLEERFGVVVLAYALMPNHFHLLVKSKCGLLSNAMAWLQSGHARRIHKRLGTTGAMFRCRFKSCLVETDVYLEHLFAYLHLNPLRIDPAHVDDPLWTSHLPILSGQDWLHADETLARFGGMAAFSEHVCGVGAGRTHDPDFDARSLWVRRPRRVLLPQRLLDQTRSLFGFNGERAASPQVGSVAGRRLSSDDAPIERSATAQRPSGPPRPAGLSQPSSAFGRQELSVDLAWAPTGRGSSG